jgi:hypothetical protein
MYSLFFLNHFVNVFGKGLFSMCYIAKSEFPCILSFWNYVWSITFFSKIINKNKIILITQARAKKKEEEEEEQVALGSSRQAGNFASHNHFQWNYNYILRYTRIGYGVQAGWGHCVRTAIASMITAFHSSIEEHVSPSFFVKSP